MAGSEERILGNEDVREPKLHRFGVNGRLLPSIIDGSKTVEVRVGDSVFLGVSPGDLILFNNNPSALRSVSEVKLYSDFNEMLRNEDPSAIIPGFEADAVLGLLRAVYKRGRERLGVLAFHLQIPEGSEPNPPRF